MAGVLCSMVGASFTVAAAPSVIRYKKSIRAINNAQISTTQSKFGGSSVYLDGVDDWLDITTDNSDCLFGTADDFTIEQWIYPASTASGRVMWSIWEGATFRASFYFDGGQVCFYSAGTGLITTGDYPTANTWSHWAITRSGGTTKFWYNGVETASTTSSWSASFNRMVLGGETPSGTSIANDYQGYFDELRISKSSRYSAGFSVATAPFTNDDNTVLLAHMNGTNATTFFDDDNGIRSQVSVRAVGSTGISTTQSKFGASSLLFDGTGDYLIAADDNLLYWNTQPYTVEYWCRITSLTSQTNDDPTIIGNLNPGGLEDYWSFGPDNSGNLTFKYYNGTSYTVKDTGTMSTGVWYHCAAVIASNTIKIYLDGIEKASASIVGTPQFSTSYGGLNIGWGNGSQGYNGYLDEIRVSNTARYTANFVAPVEPFVNDANTLLLLHADGNNSATVIRDDNGYSARRAYHISAYGAAQLSTAQAKFGATSALFDGNDDYLLINSLPSTANSDYTWECWARFDILPWNQTLGGGSYIMLATGGSGDYFLINRTGAGSQVSFQIATANKYGSFTKSGVDLAINTWYHIAFVRNSGVWKVFFNGTELTTFTNDSGFTNSGRTENMSFATIGRFIDSRGSMDGYLDEIRISTSARYTSDFTPSTTPFVNDANTLLLCHCDGYNTSTAFIDDNGGRQQRTPQAFGNAQISASQSKFGSSSLALDGTGDYLLRQNISSSNKWTLECWFRANNISGEKYFFQVYDSANNFVLTTGLLNANLYMYAGGTSSGGTVSANTWYHFAIHSDGSSMVIFLDGTAVTSRGTIGALSNYKVYIGGYSSGTGMNGFLDEVRISEGLRYPTNFTPSTAPFVNDANTIMLLHCDGTSGSTVFPDDNGKITT